MNVQKKIYYDISRIQYLCWYKIIFKKLKTSRMKLCSDNARGECWENTREACKTRGVVECFSRLSSILPTFPERTP